MTSMLCIFTAIGIFNRYPDYKFKNFIPNTKLSPRENLDKIFNFCTKKIVDDKKISKI